MPPNYTVLLGSIILGKKNNDFSYDGIPLNRKLHSHSTSKYVQFFDSL